MSNFPTPEQRNQTLYYQCLEQLLPLAGHRIQAVALDWWDLDRFLGLAFHIFLTEKESQVRSQIAQILPNFGAKAVLTLVVILRQQTIDTELKALASQCLQKIETSELIDGLIHLLRTSDDESFDSQVIEMLVDIGPDSIAAVEALLSETASRAIALRILPPLQLSLQVANLEEAFDYSPNPLPVIARCI
ncbi:MAG: hypothetical protein AAF329_20950 [Cyanobacteria bacterium P01_A01_bin.17]